MADNDNRRGRWQGFDFGGGGGGGDRRRWRFTLAYVLLGVAALWLLQMAFTTPPEEIAYSEFLDRVEAGDVQS
ncbi:MAG: ATP-dependent metallopeptidase FtsH/Yme1/Tma family protein, partial [Actinomycetota bacterium]